jgi:hypothetical protein
MEQKAFEQNAPARALARKARSLDQAHWPTQDQKSSYLNSLRELANDLGDAALYEHLQGDDSAAVQSVRDVMHIARLLRVNHEPNKIIQTLVGAGIEALGMYRLMIIAPGMQLTIDPADKSAVQVSDVRQLISELLNPRWTPSDLLKEVYGDDYKAKLVKPKDLAGQLTETFDRIEAERTMAAMSLACQLFRFEKGHWPATLEDLAPAYLPRVPVDPWGDGKQTFGYTLIKGVLPAGLDRPLVFSRCQSADGLAPRTDEPQYGFYANEGWGRWKSQKKHTGNFGVVARCIPISHVPTDGPDDRL